MKVNLFPKHVTQHLSAYCQGELPADLTPAVERHLANCARCQKEQQEIKRGIALAQQLQVGLAPAKLWTAVSQALAAPPRPARMNWQPAVALLAIFAIGLGGWFWVQRKPAEKIAAPDFASRELATVTATIAPTPLVTKDPAPLSLTEIKASRTGISPNTTWEVARVKGTPRINNEKITATGKLGVGEWLETDNDSAAQVKVAEIGYLDLAPNSRVQLVETKNTQHRIALTRGKVSALILAPPRLFLVDTPTATAVDLGCAYTLEVDAAGASILHVTSGWVSFVRDGQELFIPAGATCETRKGRGLGIPYYDDAAPTFKSALQTLAFEKEAKVSSLIHFLLTAARERDSFTLWHLLGRNFRKQTLEIRGAVFDRLAVLAPPPKSVTRAGILRGDGKMLTEWWENKIR